jgi:coproporphyrinogen III oxidase
MKEQFYSYIQNLQDQIVAGLEAVDGQAKFREDLWDRSEGGGRTSNREWRSIRKRRVNISVGNCRTACKSYLMCEADFSCGLSLVLHLKALWCLVHANWRYFKCTMRRKCNSTMVWWRTGSYTYYLFEEDATHFHQSCKTACDKHNPEFYQNIKQCDAYFWNAHRNEAE